MFFSSSLNEWIAFNVVNNKGKNLNDDWSSFWALACHLAWTWRNKEKHDDHFIPPVKQVEVIRQRINSYKLVDRVLQHGIQHQQTMVQIGWTPPMSGWVCVNIDGACRDGIIGCGGVIRGSVGERINGFSKSIGREDAYIAELWGRV
jgi:hypothetical protein